jgi:uncharacterized protein DUF7009
MKLRLRGNSLRLRLNQNDAAELASGRTLVETLTFPGGANFQYTLAAPESSIDASAQLVASTIAVTLPEERVKRWAAADDVGIYFELAAGDSVLKVAVEKDLECLDAPPEERDPFAYPRETAC